MMNRVNESMEQNQIESENVDQNQKTEWKDNSIRIQSEGFQNYFMNLVRKSKNISQQMNQVNHLNNFPYLTQKDRKISVCKQKVINNNQNIGLFIQSRVDQEQRVGYQSD